MCVTRRLTTSVIMRVNMIVILIVTRRVTGSVNVTGNVILSDTESVI